MAFLKTSETVVEATGSDGKIVYPSAIRVILTIISFLKWAGCFPVTIMQTRVGLLQVSFAGYHFATLLWIVFFSLQVYLTAAYISMRKHFTHISDTIIFALFYCNVCCSVIFIPRCFVAKRKALQSTLNNITEIHRSLESSFAEGKFRAVSIVFLILEFFTIIPNVMKAYYSDNDVVNSPIFSLGTGNSVIGFAMHLFWGAFYYISLWVVPLQLFVLCRTVASYFEDLAGKIQSLNVNVSSSYLQETSEIFATRSINASHLYKMRLKTLHAFCVKLEKTVDNINEYFGMSLSLFFLCHVANILACLNSASKHTADIANSSLDNNFEIAFALVLLVRHIAELNFVIWTSDLLASAATKCKEAVRSINFFEQNTEADGTSHLQFQYFQNHVASMKVEISAIGLFSVTRKTFLPVLGTIITYYLIIVQYTKDYGNENHAKNSIAH